MFGMSMTEIVIILVVALLILGPKELPKAAKAIGKTLREVRRAGDDLRDTFEREVMRDDNDPRRPVKAPEGAVATGADDAAEGANAPPKDDATSAEPVPADAPVAKTDEAEAPAAPVPSRTGSA